MGDTAGSNTTEGVGPKALIGVGASELVLVLTMGAVGSAGLRPNGLVLVERGESDNGCGWLQPHRTRMITKLAMRYRTVHAFENSTPANICSYKYITLCIDLHVPCYTIGHNVVCNIINTLELS